MFGVNLRDFLLDEANFSHIRTAPFSVSEASMQSFNLPDRGREGSGMSISIASRLLQKILDSYLLGNARLGTQGFLSINPLRVPKATSKAKSSGLLGSVLTGDAYG